ncbi:MAG: prepilin-type N-terminal cleavage/methylation domain-containing protein [Patescibacteria group bacterium]|mgnify:CR=1 FL=1
MKRNRKFFSRLSGFTLVELMLTITLVTVLAGLSIPLYQSFQVKNATDIAANTLAQTFRRAQIISRASDGDTSWGVKAQNGSIVLFKGASYSGRDTTFDEIFNLPSTITPSGATEIVYTKFTGIPQATGTITLTASTGDIRTLTINSKGTVTY